MRRDAAEDALDDAAQDAAHEHARVDALEAQVNTVKARLGDAADQAGEERTSGGDAHIPLLVPHGNDHDTGSGAEAGEVPGAHGALNEVVAVVVDVEQHDRVDGPVQAQRHHEGVDQRDDDAEDEGRDVVDRLQEVGEPGADVDADRSQEEARQRNHDEHGEEGHEDQLDVSGDDLLEPLRQRPEHCRQEQGREDLRSVVEDRQGKGAEELDSRDLGPHEGHARGLVYCSQRCESGQHGDGHDGEADPGIRSELLRGVVGHHERQEVEDRAPGEVEERPARRECDTRVRPVADDAERAHQRHEGDEDRGSQQRADERSEGVGEELEEVVHPGELSADPACSGCGLDVVVGGGLGTDVLHLRQRHDALVHRLHGAADDDLVALTGLRNRTHDTGDLLDGGGVDGRGIDELEPQARRAVGEMGDVLRAADGGEDRLRGRGCCCHQGPFVGRGAPPRQYERYCGTKGSSGPGVGTVPSNWD